MDDGDATDIAFRRKCEVRSLNTVFVFFIALGCAVAFFTGNVESLMLTTLDGAKGAVELVIGLTGMFALWVGIEKLARESGLIDALGVVTRPFLGVLFPHLRQRAGTGSCAKEAQAALGTISASIVSNILGLSSSTPLGLKAMSEMKGVLGEGREAVDSMITLVVINAAGFCIFPSSVIALRAALGSGNPAAIAGPTAVAGLAATFGGLAVHWCLSSRKGGRHQ